MPYDEQVKPLSTDKAYIASTLPLTHEQEYCLDGMAVVTGAWQAPEGLVQRHVAAGRYAAFDCSVKTIGQTWQAIFNERGCPGRALKCPLTGLPSSTIRRKRRRESRPLHLPSNQASDALNLKVGGGDMIELPEALVIARQMNEVIAGKTIASAIRGNAPHKFAFYTRSAEEYAEILKDRQIGPARGHGGLILIPHRAGLSVGARRWRRADRAPQQ